MNQNKIQADWPRPGTWLRRVAILLCLVVGVVFTIRATTGRALATSTGSDSSVTQVPIERIELGQRVVGRNPLREQTQAQAEIDPATWRRIDLETEQGGVRYDLSFLRPLSWIKSQGAVEGGAFDLVMDEIGINGPVRVVRISACPPIEPDDHTGRCVVTGTMSHPAENILSLDIQGEARPLGVTTTHPMWSVDQSRFVVAGELKIGERLRREDGTHAQVTRITPHRGPPEMVYNLEVNGEHVYCVSSGALLVHNSCGKLDYDPTTGSWASSEGLVYGQGSAHGNRVKHVLEHLSQNPNKPLHTVFDVGRTKLIGLIDEAWSKRSGLGLLQANGNRTWTIDMGRAVGTNGERYIQIVVEDGTSNIITAFPKLLP